MKLKWVGVLLGLTVLTACATKPTEVKTVYVDKVVEKPVVKVIEVPKSLYQCEKPQRVKDIIDLEGDNTSEDDLFNAFKKSYLNHIKCYKSMEAIQKYVNEAKKAHETKQR